MKTIGLTMRVSYQVDDARHEQLDQMSNESITEIATLAGEIKRKLGAESVDIVAVAPSGFRDPLPERYEPRIPR